MVLSAFPQQARHLLCLVGAETGAPAGASSGAPAGPRSGEPVLWYRYQLTSIGPLGLGPAALTALLADAVLGGIGLAGGSLTDDELAGGPAAGPGGRATVRHSTGVPPGAAGSAALGTVIYAKGRLAGPRAGPAATSPPGTSPPGTGPPGAWTGGPAGMPAGVRHRATAGHVVVLGADLAVARAALGLGATRLTLAGVPPARAEALSAALPAPARVRAAALGDLAEVLAEADGLVRVTPARPRSPVPVPAGLLRPGAWVADLAYRPMASGAARPAPPGHRDGMFAWQTVGAFRLATGPGTDAEQALRYLAAVTGTVAGNARAASARTAPAR
jgi:hypothetical protein